MEATMEISTSKREKAAFEEEATVQLVVPSLRTVGSHSQQVQNDDEAAAGQWVIDINRSLEENHTFDGGKSWSIYRVPERLRQIQESAFAPKLVSIGPFHYKNKNLQAGNEHKMRFLVRLLGGKFDKDETDIRKIKPHRLTKEDSSRCEPMVGIKLEKLEKAMKFLENNARACYSEAFNDMSSDEFVRMMVLDGCFIIEILRLHYHQFDSKLVGSHHKVKDPIFHSHWMIQTLKSDFMMFENQLPFFVLHLLFSLIMRRGGVELVTLGSFFFNSLIDHNNRKASQYSTNPKSLTLKSDKCDHLLHLFLFGFTSRLLLERKDHSYRELLDKIAIRWRTKNRVDGLIEPKGYQKLSYHARELQEAGVEIVKQKEDKEGLLGIDIDGGKQLIRMHPLYLDDTSAVMLLNFLAFEQCHHVINPYFTNYIVFLDCLIDNEYDVEVLHKAGVLNHAFGNNNDVANLMNKVGREIVCDPNHNYLHHDMKALNSFCKSYYASRLRTWWRNLIRNYFSTPWTAISLVAAFILLMLTLIQTFYTTYAYYKPPN